MKECRLPHGNNMKRRIRNAYTKSVGKEWYKKMLAHKQAKADKAKREKMGPLDLTQPDKAPLPEGPKRLEVSEPTYSSKMDENTSSSAAIEKALSKLREQAKGI